MLESVEAQLARHDQRLDDMADDITALRDDHRADHHRLRAVESAVTNMVEAQKLARRSEERQYRRLELRIQVLTLVVGLAAVASPIIVAVMLK